MSNLYEVEAILLSRPASAKSRKKGSITLDKLTPHDKEYFIKWKGYSIIESTWEPFENLKNVKTMVSEFIAHDEKKLAKNPNYKTMISNPQFACEELTDKRSVNGRDEYLVRWKDFEQETWEDWGNLPHEAIAEYEQKRTDEGDVYSQTSITKSAILNQVPINRHHHEEGGDASDEHHKKEDTEFGGDDNANLDEDLQDQLRNKRKQAPSSSLPAPLEKRRKLTKEEEEEEAKVSYLNTEREKLTSDADKATFDLIVKHPWEVSKIFQESAGGVAVRATYGELKQEKFPLELFRIVHPQKVIDFFLARTKFSTPGRASVGATQQQ